MDDITGPIDLTEVMEIVDGDQKLLMECFDEFLSGMPQVLAEIQSSIEQNNASGLDESAHRLKGSLKYMAAGVAADVAYQLEVMGKEENLDLAHYTFRILCEECEKVKYFMKQYKVGVNK
jgi:HPt (histidine-containing phosphotransfer) domain-containing protein